MKHRQTKMSRAALNAVKSIDTQMSSGKNSTMEQRKLAALLKKHEVSNAMAQSVNIYLSKLRTPQEVNRSSNRGPSPMSKPPQKPNEPQITKEISNSVLAKNMISVDFEPEKPSDTTLERQNK